MCSPIDGSEIPTFSLASNPSGTSLKSPDENYFAVTPQNRSPANDFRSDDCNELLAKELADLEEEKRDKENEGSKFILVSQSSIEIEIRDDDTKGIGENNDSCCDIKEESDGAEVKNY